MTASFLSRLILTTALLSAVGQAAPSPEAIQFFENKIRPILVESCQECHAEKKHKGELRVDNLPYLLQGGSTGPAVVPHKPEESVLIHAVSYSDPDMEMPPEGKLPDDQIAALKQWILMGAPWPEAEVAGAKMSRRPGDITDEDRKWWSFQPVSNPPVPKTSANHPVDAFIQAELTKNKLKTSPEATPHELIRRLTFDLHGLPPEPSVVDQFVEEYSAAKAQDKLDQTPSSQTRADGVFASWVDKLLASPHYGERWAQHWLDLTRYAESEGYRLDSYRPNVWPYRDYVIQSLNDDKPYDQFVREQLAGDEIAPNDPKTVIATAFLRHTIYEYNQRDVETQWRNILNEVTDVTADVFLGMSVQCAQCHDHKFDPILQKDYYRLQSFLANITWPENKKLATPAEIKAHDDQMKIWLAATVEPRAIIDRIIEPRIEKAQTHAMEIFPEEVVAMWKKPQEQRTPYEEQIVQLAWRQAEYERYRFKTDKIKDPEATQLKDAQIKLAEFDHLKPASLLTAYIIGETGPKARDASFKTRKAGQTEAKPGFLTILDPTDATIPKPKPGMTTSGRRTVLANWLTRPENPLTTRVIVNRLWQYHFGRGIVATPSDYGHLGEKPTHPELLDWLTTQFIQGGWKMKSLHKLILTSAAYRQSALVSQPSAMQIDPETKLLWRFPPRRLDAEQSRDAILAASGELDATIGGEGVEAAKPRRSIYTRKMRNTQDAFLQSLDAPPGFASVPTRDATTTATQSLLMINGDWPLERSAAMASRLIASKPSNDAQIIDLAYDLTFSRNPTAKEKSAALSFLSTQRARLKKELPAQAPLVPALTDAKTYLGSTAASKTVKTLWMQPGSPNEKLQVKNIPQIEGDKFSIEAVVNLNSLYPNGSVRTIASRWDNDKTSAGWALGVTSEKSAHKPNNLIVQLVGEDFQRSLVYEVVPSGLRLSLSKPYYVAVEISNEPAEGQKFGGTVTFYLRDLGDPSAPMQTVTVPHQICGNYVNPTGNLYIGGREKDKGSLWHGAIARVMMHQGSLNAGELMTWTGMNHASCLLDLNADRAAEMLKTTWKWETNASITTPKGKSDPNREAITDLCHVLLNANEFFYLQ